MKKIVALSVATLLIFAMMFNLVACTGNTDPDTEESTTAFVRMETVSEENVVAYVNFIIEKSNAQTPVINVSESFAVDAPRAFAEGENKGVETLGDTLGFIKTYLMNGFSAPAPVFDTMFTVDEADVASVVNYDIYTARNWTSENVTDEEGESIAYEEDVPKYQFDEDGNELTDMPVTNEDGEQEYYENGDIMAKSYVCDNKLKVTVSFLKNPAAEGEEEVFADAETINKYFPNTVDKDYVLTELAKVNTAVTVSDYSVAYRDCTIFFEVDMETEQILNATLTKNVLVTFDAMGQGSFADLGNFNIDFNFRDTVNLTFDYSAEEVVEGSEDAAATDVVTDEATEIASAEVTEAETTSEEAVSLDDTTVADASEEATDAVATVEDIDVNEAETAAE